VWQVIGRIWTRWDFVRRIRKHGWTATYVPGDDSETNFAYSIGFWECLGTPEVIVFGADLLTSNGLIGEAYTQLKSGDLKLADKAPWILEMDDGPRLAWRAVHPSQIRRAHFNVAIWYRERQGQSRAGLEAFQLFVSDTAGVLPWEEGFDTDYRPHQPELYLPYLGPPEDD